MADEAYVLITAAKNEQDYIEKTIQAVAAQTVLPKQWIIVSDGSTDRTEDIVEQYARRCHFIKLVKLGASSRRDFAAKVNAIRTGCAQLKNVEYEFWGNLMPMSRSSRHYEMILQKFGQFSVGMPAA
jgi:glycosyltransferase involved in cell wall biosynthesis